MKNKIGLETILGGIFGIIAVIAIIGEVIYAGFTIEAVLGGVKDIAGTLVTVMVFIVAVKNLIPKKESKTFEGRLTEALTSWQKANSTLIVKSGDDDKTGSYGLSMRTNINDFYNATPSSKIVGWFVRLPAIASSNYCEKGIVIKFHLNKGTFFEGLNYNDVQTKAGLDKLSKKFVLYINHCLPGFAKAVQKSFDNIDVVLEEAITTDEDIAKLTQLLNSMYQAYLASANISLK